MRGIRLQGAIGGDGHVACLCTAWRGPFTVHAQGVNGLGADIARGAAANLYG